MQKYSNRESVPSKYKWDLTTIFKDDAAFEATLKKNSEQIMELKNYIGCTKDAQKLYEFITKEIETGAVFENLYVYSYLKNDEVLGIAKNIEQKNKVLNLSSILDTNTSFFAPELLQLSHDQYQNLFIKNPKLNAYKFLLDETYREKEHTLTAKEEEIIGKLVSAMNSYDDISSNLINSEHDYGWVKLENGEIIPIATNNYHSLLQNKNQSIRKKVYQSLNKRIAEYSGTSANLLNSYVKMNQTMADIRHFKDSWDAKLFGLNLDNKIFEVLVNTVETNTSVLQKFYELKKTMLKLKSMHLYDTSVPMIENNHEYTIDEAQKITLNAVKPLGQDYVNKFKKIFDNHYIDYCQYKGKCSGGYSFATSTNDSRILMSYTGNFDSVSTIAHEGGHNVHHQYVKENNPLAYRETSSLVAEVASLTNECLLSNYLKNNGATKTEKLVGLENIINVINSNLFGAVREGKMEQNMYDVVKNDGTLTNDYLNDLTLKSLKKYYGKTIKLDDYSALSWVRRSHYYMHFYLYSYAICISVATNVASKIIAGDSTMLTNYLAFLKQGSDVWPSDAFKVLGIDLTKSEVYQNAINYYQTLITEFKEIATKEA